MRNVKKEREEEQSDPKGSIESGKEINKIWNIIYKGNCRQIVLK